MRSCRIEGRVEGLTLATSCHSSYCAHRGPAGPRIAAAETSSKLWRKSNSAAALKVGSGLTQALLCGLAGARRWPNQFDLRLRQKCQCAHSDGCH